MNTKYWNLSLTLIISFTIFVFFTILQSAVLLFFSSENSEISTNGYENIAYANLGANLGANSGANSDANLVADLGANLVTNLGC